MSRNDAEPFTNDIYSICSSSFNYAKKQFWENLSVKKMMEDFAQNKVNK